MTRFEASLDTLIAMNRPHTNTIDSCAVRRLAVRSASLTTCARITAIVCLLAVMLAPTWVEAAFPSGKYPYLFNKEHGWIDASASQLAAFDVIEAAWWNTEGDQAAVLADARVDNPQLVRLAYYNPLGIGLPSIGDPNHIVNRYLAQIPPEWYAYNDSGERIYFPQWPDMPIMNLSSQCPEVNGETWVEFCVRFVVDEILETGLWEGIHWDNQWVDLSWTQDFFPGSYDLNNDGIADDPDDVDAWFQAAIDQLHHEFRAQVGSTPVTLGNGGAAIFDAMNGRYYEAFPRDSAGGWSGSMLQADAWNENGLQPAALQFVTRGAINNYQQVRFGFCSALLVGGMYWHEPEVDPKINWTIYDEYTVDLGSPKGPREEIGINYVVDYNMEFGAPAGLDLGCWNASATLTSSPSEVIEGGYSIRGEEDGVPDVWSSFMCTDNSVISLDPGATYTIEYDYRILEEPFGDGYFYVSMRTANDNDPTVGISSFDDPAGTTAHVRKEFTVPSIPGYFIYFGMKNGGRIVIDNLQILEGYGGVFRREFTNGLTYVNPTDEVRQIDLDGVYYKIDGTVNPITNNGQAVTTIVLQPEDAILLTNNPGGTPSSVDQPSTDVPDEPEGSSPPVALRPVVYPNPMRMVDNALVTVTGVPENGSVRIYSVAGRLVQQLDEISVTGVAAWDLRGFNRVEVRAGVYFVELSDSAHRRIKTLKLAIGR